MVPRDGAVEHPCREAIEPVCCRRHLLVDFITIVPAPIGLAIQPRGVSMSHLAARVRPLVGSTEGRHRKSRVVSHGRYNRWATRNGVPVSKDVVYHTRAAIDQP